MPVELIKTKYGYYLPMDGPWQSEEDNAAYKAAFELFEEMRIENDYVALIRSHHEYSHGYWLETRRRNVQFPDHILIQNFK